MNEKMNAMLASYGRSVLGAASTLYLAGVTDPKDLAYSLAGALLPVVLRYINPNDKAFGRLPAVAEVDTALKAAKVVKKSAAKKTVKKKTDSK